MACLAQQTIDIEDKIHKIFQVPLSHKEITDIHVAYRECATRAVSNPKCKPFRPPRTGKKKLELLNCKNAIEITYHDLDDPQLPIDQLDPHDINAYPTEWSIQWDSHTQNEIAEHAMCSTCLNFEQYNLWYDNMLSSSRTYSNTFEDSA